MSSPPRTPPRTRRQTGRVPPPLTRRPRRSRPASPSGGDDVNPLWAPQYTPPPRTNVGTTPLRRRPPTISNRRQLPNRSNRRVRLPNNNNVRRNLNNEHFRRIHQNEQNRQNNIQHRNHHDHTIPFDQRPDYDPSTQRNPNGSSRMPEPEQQTLKF